MSDEVTSEDFDYDEGITKALRETILPQALSPVELKRSETIPDEDLRKKYERYAFEGPNAYYWDEILWKMKGILDTEGKPALLRKLLQRSQFLVDFSNVYTFVAEDKEFSQFLYDLTTEKDRRSAWFVDVASYIYNPKNAISAFQDHRIFKPTKREKEHEYYSKFSDNVEWFSRLVLADDLIREHVNEMPSVMKHYQFLAKYNLLYSKTTR